MPARTATLDDVPALTDLAETTRLAGRLPSHGGAADVPSMRRVLLAQRLGASDLPVVVVERDGALHSAAWIARSRRPDGTWWVIDEILLGQRRWADAGLPLLVAVAGRAGHAGAPGLVVACRAEDQEGRESLAAAGLRLSAWRRHRKLDPHHSAATHPSVRAVVDADLPALHAADPERWPETSAEWLTALVAGRDGPDPAGEETLLAAVGITVQDRSDPPSTMVLDPVLTLDEGTTADADRLIAAASWLALRRRFRHLGVNVGPDQAWLDDTLTARGFTRTTSYFTLRFGPNTRS